MHSCCGKILLISNCAVFASCWALIFAADSAAISFSGTVSESSDSSGLIMTSLFLGSDDFFFDFASFFEFGSWRVTKNFGEEALPPDWPDLIFDFEEFLARDGFSSSTAFPSWSFVTKTRLSFCLFRFFGSDGTADESSPPFDFRLVAVFELF